MRRPTNITGWCALLLVIAYAAENPENSTHRDEQDDTIQYKLHFNFTTAWNHDENSTMQHEFQSNSWRNLYKESGRDVPAELRDNSTKLDDGDYFTMSHELRPENSSNENNLKTMCNDTACFPICCELDYRMIKDRCKPDFGKYSFPEVHEVGKKANDFFDVVVSDPCKNGRFLLDPDDYPEDEYVILPNGTIYKPNVDSFLDSGTYCFAVLKDKYQLTQCFDEFSEIVDEVLYFFSMSIGIIASLPLLLTTFVVYTILPELRNMHGYTLRGYVGCLFMAYIIISPLQLINQYILPGWICIGTALAIHFSFLASFFWLNVLCFDIWWTFRKFRSLQDSVKQRERKKFIMYSIYAWGCSSISTIICVIMDFAPDVPENFIKPGFGIERCWYRTQEGKAIYFYGPLILIIICNICLFISTAFTILHHKKNTAHHLRDSESRRHDDNKQQFNLYLKLFIVMGNQCVIYWFMEIITSVYQNVPPYIWYLSDLTNFLQSLIIFITFVWNDKIKKLLLKRFGCTASRTCITSGISLEEKNNFYVQTNCHTKNLSNETDCP